MKLRYRLTVIACALSWFLVGLHAPAVHNMLDHGRTYPPGLLAVMLVLAVGAILALWLLLRGQPQARSPV